MTTVGSSTRNVTWVSVETELLSSLLESTLSNRARFTSEISLPESSSDASLFLRISHSGNCTILKAM